MFILGLYMCFDWVGVKGVLFDFLIFEEILRLIWMWL